MVTTLTFDIAPRRSARPRSRVLSALAATGAVVLIAAALSALGREDASSPQPVSAAAPSPVVGVFTGEFDAGAPVYRLPPVEVVGHREDEPARRVGAGRPAVLM